MIIREFQILTEALWEAVKSDLKFFAPISKFVKDLSEVNLDTLNKELLSDIGIYVTQIENYFDRYRSKSDAFYFPPAQTSTNDATVRKIYELYRKLNSLNDEELANEVSKLKPKLKLEAQKETAIFIGHGRSKLWARLQLYIKDELGIPTFTFESETHTGETIINILTSFLDKSSFAILVLTAEDETVEGSMRARQNVIHEAGLFQGRLGFEKVILLKHSNTEDLSNLAGLQYIPFTGDNIEQTFYELSRVLKKHGLVQ